MCCELELKPPESLKHISALKGSISSKLIVCLDDESERLFTIQINGRRIDFLWLLLTVLYGLNICG